MTSKTNPARRLEVIIPTDGVNFSPPARGFILSTTGSVALIAEDDTTSVVIPSLIGGVIHPISCKQILNTGTTATSIVLVR